LRLHRPTIFSALIYWAHRAVILAIAWFTCFKKWQLQPSLSKTVSSVHHLPNARANQTLKLLLNDQTIRHEPNSVYLGVTLDRTLSSWNASRDIMGVHRPQLSGRRRYFCSRVLRSCLVKISLHQAGRCTAQRIHAHCFGNTLIYSTSMVTST